MSFAYENSSQRRKQEYMQQLSVLKNGFSPHEKEALEEMNFRVSKTLTFNAMKTFPLTYLGVLSYSGFKLSDYRNILKHLKSVSFGIHLCAISAGLFFANLMTPKTEIIKDTLKRHNITTEENLGKLIAMQEEHRACSRFPLNFTNYTQYVKNDYNDNLHSRNKQLGQESQERDDAFENFYAKKSGRRMNSYGDELDSDKV
uniref:Uncharacterized protein LOC111124795 n=1 Tax=Crassostrea virginica TaxID=6565 RepID=A0A8B8D7U7_CRAVI|nr:uncharacterized protein LOC111124795 [Crassostrea virginica]XP_022323695.1 uncharacterized protein LOC111124796 [Crassostrea virginica]